MRAPAQRSMDLQDNLPSQAAGGYDKDLGSTLRAALIRWEKKRGLFSKFKLRKFKNEKRNTSKVVGVA